MSNLLNEMRSRAERMLRGERNTEDLHRIIMWLRGRTTGSVRDIGDFMAHFDERNRGYATEEMTDYLAFVKLKLRSYDAKMPVRDGKTTFAFDSMPQDFAIGLKAGIRSIGLERLSQLTGIAIFRIPLMISGICGKAFLNPDGTMSLMEMCDDEERGLLRHIVGNDDGRGLYTLDGIFPEFVQSLIKFTIINKNDKRVDVIKPFYGMFVCSILDRCIIKRIGIKATLLTLISPQGELIVAARARSHKIKTGGTIYTSAPIFLTGLHAVNYVCSNIQSKLSDLNADRGTIEIDRNGLLNHVI